jgi:hypothetical protein
MKIARRTARGRRQGSVCTALRLRLLGPRPARRTEDACLWSLGGMASAGSDPDSRDTHCVSSTDRRIFALSSRAVCAWARIQIIQFCAPALQHQRVRTWPCTWIVSYRRTACRCAQAWDHGCTCSAPRPGSPHRHRDTAGRNPAERLAVRRLAERRAESPTVRRWAASVLRMCRPESADRNRRLPPLQRLPGRPDQPLKPARVQLPRLGCPPSCAISAASGLSRVRSRDTYAGVPAAGGQPSTAPWPAAPPEPPGPPPPAATPAPRPVSAARRKHLALPNRLHRPQNAELNHRTHAPLRDAAHTSSSATRTSRATGATGEAEALTSASKTAKHRRMRQE